MSEKGAKQKKSKKTPPAERSGDDMVKSYQSSIPNYLVHEGVPFPGALLTKRVSEIRDFHIRSDDVIICGYPRSGEKMFFVLFDLRSYIFFGTGAYIS